MLQTDPISKVLHEFSPISLKEMGAVKLMNRVDTKFVTHQSNLIPLLKLLHQSHMAQEINGNRMSAYRTLYFDTETKAMYGAHQNGKATREKIRMREYLGSDLVFLEVKNKNNRGRTKKTRIQLPGWNEYQNEAADSFLREKAWYELEHIVPHLQNSFKRITLVNREKTERLTIDLNLGFHNLDNEATYNLKNLIVIELKQDGFCFSYSRQCLRDLRIHPMGFSKYCMGCALTNPHLKQNNFKERLSRIRKMVAFTN